MNMSNINYVCDHALYAYNVNYFIIMTIRKSIIWGKFVYIVGNYVLYIITVALSQLKKKNNVLLSNCHYSTLQ